MRRVALAIAAATVLSAPALAGDYAESEVIGFSANGAVFVFDEYGEQDGSGFPYSNIYFIDTVNDAWLPNTPIRVLLQDDGATVQTARVQSWDQAVPILQGLQGGFGGTGRTVLTNPITELPTVPHHAEFLVFANAPLQATGYSLDIETYPLPTAAASFCPDFYDAYFGYRLTMTLPDGSTRVLSEDSRIPESRGCPVDYGIAEVVVYDRGEDTVVVVLLNLFKVGFEGPDRRFLAVPTIVPNG